MTSRQYDAQLHLLRSVARAQQDQRAKHEIDSARFNLFAALQAKDVDAAKQWLRALDVAICAAEDPANLRPAAALAIAEIHKGLEADHA